MPEPNRSIKTVTLRLWEEELLCKLNKGTCTVCYSLHVFERCSISSCCCLDYNTKLESLPGWTQKYLRSSLEKHLPKLGSDHEITLICTENRGYHRTATNSL